MPSKMHDLMRMNILFVLALSCHLELTLITDDVIIRGKGSDCSVIDYHQYWVNNSGQTDGYPFDSSSTVLAD